MARQKLRTCPKTNSNIKFSEGKNPLKYFFSTLFRTPFECASRAFLVLVHFSLDGNFCKFAAALML